MFGTVTAGAGAPAVALACNAALSACMVSCGPTVVADSVLGGPMGICIAAGATATALAAIWYFKR